VITEILDKFDFVHLMLKLNQDFDDDLLQEATLLLGEIDW
jgi:hypothetical protein